MLTPDGESPINSTESTPSTQLTFEVCNLINVMGKYMRHMTNIKFTVKLHLRLLFLGGRYLVFPYLDLCTAVNKARKKTCI